jgi:hypothetical protein
MSRYAFLIIPLLLLASLPASAQTVDTDKDGLPDAVELQLGTNPAFAEQLQQIATDKTKDQGDTVGKDNYSPGLDLVALSLGNVAGNRYLWRVDFLAPFEPANSGLILYVDADSDTKTGRSDMGCEYMLVNTKGVPTIRAFAADGKETAEGCRVAVVGKSVYLCADLTFKQVDGKATGTVNVLHETEQPHVMVDGISKTAFAVPGDSTRPKIVIPGEETQTRNLNLTWGFRNLEQIKQNPKNTLLHAWECDLHGYALNITTEYANRHVIPSGSGPRTITAKVPNTGNYHLGFFTYQRGGRQNMLVKLNGQDIGLAVCTEDNRRQCLFFTPKPIAVKAGDSFELESIFGGQLVEDLILMPQPPPLVKLDRKLTNLEARPALTMDGRVVGEITFITTWPATCTLRCGSETQTDPEPLANHRFWLPDVKPGEKITVTVETQTPEGQSVKQQAQLVASIQPPRGKIAQANLPLVCENTYPTDLKSWPVTQGLPFPQGALVSADSLRLLDAAGQEIPLQATVLGYWPDFSIKWILLDFQTNLTAKQTSKFTLEYGTNVRRLPVAKPLKLDQTAQATTINTGILKVELPANQPGFMGRLWLDRNGDGQFSDDELISGPKVGESRLTLGAATGSTAASPATVKIIRQGPLHCIVRVDGGVDVAGAKFGDQVDLHFYAGKAWVATSHTFTNRNNRTTFSNLDSLYLSRDLNLGSGVKGQFGNDRVGGSVPDAQGSSRVGGSVPDAQPEPPGTVGATRIRSVPDAQPEPPGTVGATRISGARISGATRLSGPATLWQGFDDNYRVTGLGADTTGKRAANWADATGSAAGVTVAVRYLWQLYPKSITLRPDGIDIGLMPKFAAGTYKISEPGKLEDKLYFYLKDDAYKLKYGVSKRHEMLWMFHSAGDAPAAAEATAFDEPPVLKADSHWYCDSKAFGDILAASPELGGIFQTYEKAAANAAESFLKSREAGREYGMLNFGDWWGERGRNWGNIEYDTQYVMYLQFVRGGDDRFLRLGEQASRHNHDVDMMWAGDPHNMGKVYTHSIGHTGGYYSAEINNQGSPSAGFSPSHSWCEGYLADYFLTGDVRGLESATLMADAYDGTYLNNYDYDNARSNGWHLIFTMGQYRATSDPYYLNAARIIVQRTKEREDPQGGWIREMTPGHCLCLPRHRGMAAFMAGVLMSGLCDYNQVMRDPKVDDMISGCADYLIRSCWVPERKTMRYTSCPVSSVGGGLSELITEGMMHGYRHRPSKVLGEVVKSGTVEAVKVVDGFGKSFTQQNRRTSAILYQFAEADLDNYNFAPGQTVTMLLKAPKDGPFKVTLRPRGQGQIGGKATLLKGDKVISEIALNQRPAVMMELPATTAAGLYALTVAPTGQVPWDMDCDLDKQIVDCSRPVKFGPGVRVPSYMVFVPTTGKTTLTISGASAAQLKSPQGKIQKLSLKQSPATIVLDPKQGFAGLCELDLTATGVFSIKIAGTLPYLSYWPGQMFAPGEPLASFDLQGNLGPGGSPAVAFDASATSDADNDVVAYSWDLGDGTKLQGKIVHHKYAKAGSYQAVLTVRDKLGTSASTKRSVAIPPQWVLDLPAQQAVVMEAEKFSGQGGGSVLITNRQGHSGSMITRWEADRNHWLEWKFTALKPGTYAVVLRYCSGTDNGCRRALTLDGASPAEAFADIKLPYTGGFADRAADWQYLRVPAQPGAASDATPAVLNLSAGQHTLRLSNLEGGCGLDQILIVPVE